MANYCDQCGGKLNPDDIFCSNCGKNIEAKTKAEQPRNEAATTYSPRYDQNRPKLYRSRDDRWVAGVCGGLGKHFNVDPILVRIIFIIAIFGYGTGLLLYIILFFFIEEEPYDSQAVSPQKPRADFG